MNLGAILWAVASGVLGIAATLSGFMANAKFTEHQQQQNVEKIKSLENENSK